MNKEGCGRPRPVEDRIRTAGWLRPPRGRAPAAREPAHPVLIIGIPGLRWSDVSAQTTPALWRKATAGSVGSLVISAVETRTCPADAWLTLNSGARAIRLEARIG